MFVLFPVGVVVLKVEIDPPLRPGTDVFLQYGCVRIVPPVVTS